LRPLNALEFWRGVLLRGSCSGLGTEAFARGVR
jgi:hypothetical protein